MQSTTWFKQMKFTEKMSLYEFKLEMEFSGYNTDRSELVEKFYKIYSDYLDELETTKSK